MSGARLLLLEDVLDAAERILRDPSRNAVRVSTRETVTLAVLALQQHAMIREAGLSYPRAPKAPPLPPPLFGPLERR
ncbi:hypothetical protein [Enterovirga rhinocerotis]|uniref:Uncharacterized protein n=1 Tax=Enterovirga rhinocerotis TaxID=1339210 RepID=A0A4R7C6G4_9HYPH|nr:hypothetical protein [Enterovirga rhinocerotis]TDR94170.1 hypothetical protein EV668_1447 [Enterovirga rhinocerotis]